VTDFVWTDDAWARRMASGNPVYPFEWAVLYRGGGRFQRVCRGLVRNSRAAPLWDVECLRIVGGGVRLEVLPATPNPRELIIRATVVGSLGNPAARGVTAYRFGFRDELDTFRGVILDGAGRLVASSTEVRNPYVGGNGTMSRTLLLVGVILLGGCDWNQDQAGAVAGPGITVHCDAEATRLPLQPGQVGDSTTKVVCPGAE
jgi:hypothetical protein